MVHLDQWPDGPHVDVCMDVPIGLSLGERMCAWRSPQRKDSRSSNAILNFYGCLYAFCFSQEPIPCNAHNNSILWHVFPHYFTQGVLICLPFCTVKTSLRCLFRPFEHVLRPSQMTFLNCYLFIFYYWWCPKVSSYVLVSLFDGMSGVSFFPNI